MPPSRSSPHPDAMPVREALRALRHGLRLGRRALRDVVPVDALPPPAARIAGGVVRGLDGLAAEVDVATTAVARRLLARAPGPAPALGELGPDAEAAFGATAYAALRAVLRRLGSPDAFVSEALLRRAHARVADENPAPRRERPAEAAASLMLAVLAAEAVRDVAADGRVPPMQVVPVATFAALLWLVSDRSEDPDGALAAAADLAAALSDEVAPAAGRRDHAALAALFAQLASHV